MDFLAFSLLLLYFTVLKSLKPRVPDIPERIAKKVGREDRQADGDTGEYGHPGGPVYAHGFIQGSAPGGVWWWHPQPQETQAGLRQDSATQASREQDEIGGHTLGRYVAKYNARRTGPHRSCRLNKLVLFH